MWHLKVIQPIQGTNLVLFDPDRYSFRWNADYTAFHQIPLLWYDDATYIDYQGDKLDFPEE